jgi:hypothetical protein
MHLSFWLVTLAESDYLDKWDKKVRLEEVDCQDGIYICASG